MPEIIIRRATPDDAPDLVRLYRAPRVLWGTLQVPYSHSIEFSRKRILEAPEGTYPLVAVVDDEVVGHLTLHTNPTRPRRRHAGALGMAVRDDWHGRGVGTALMAACLDLADNWLNLTRVELDVFVDNEPALRLYTKFGFEIEGTLRNYAYRDGRYVDTYTMSRLRIPPSLTYRPAGE